ncbi:hypothetical protein C8R47DRAFT_1209151 [Mycena vitilis]|nr:hypothetical protein C8R47DRAFT_1209151 [Mycena vitilis]
MGPLSPLERILLCVQDSLLVRLLSFWNPAEVFKFAGLSRITNGIMDHYITLVWDVDAHFYQWFRDSPSIFRSVLRRSNGVVSGSHILQFLDRTRYLDSDIDIFIRIGGVFTMGRWLLSQGYSLAAQSEDYPAAQLDDFRSEVIKTGARLPTPKSPQRPVKAVYNFQRFVASPTSIYDQRIQLIVVDTDPIKHILFDFHSTAVMNYMTSDVLVSIFPRSTLVLHKCYVTKNRFETIQRSTAWKQKYRERGFRIIEKQTRGHHSDLKLGKRTSADQASWSIKLNGKDVI